MEYPVKIECAHCCCELDEERAENPRLNEDDDPICDDCYSEHYEEVCAICEDSFDKPCSPESGHYLTISDEDGIPKYPAGIWKVLKWPFYISDCIGGGHVYDECIQWIAPLPVYKQVFGLQTIYSGSCCLECAEKYAGYQQKSI